MNIQDINTALADLHGHPSRETMLKTAFLLVKWLGLHPPAEGKERTVAPHRQEIKKYLVTHPTTRRHQLYRITAKEEKITVCLAVMKKIRKASIQQLVDKERHLKFQDAPPFIQTTASAPPYFVYFIATEKYDGISIVLQQGEQKRIVALRKKLTQTQYQKIIPQWENIAAKTKPELASLLWKSLDIKEVNKEFYKQIKTQFDNLVGIAQTQYAKANEQQIKQFAVRLIGRYIFCWFLKEKDIIPEQLLSTDTIREYEQIFSQKILYKLFFNTLNTEVTDKSRNDIATPLDELYRNIPYLNGGLFETHPEDYLFEKLDLNAWLLAFVGVLEDFDFTVDESSSQYQQVAIDPEMLGRIFENLLASQNPDTEKLANQRKAFGAFYTPREIVDYMVNESLKAHIETRLLPALPHQPDAGSKVAEPLVAYKGTLFDAVEPQQTMLDLGRKEKAEIAETEKRRERLKEKIEKLLAPDCTDNPFDKEETNKVRHALSEITMLDPACGSGAFPMGMMLRLMELRQIVGHGHNNSYDLKNEILSRNIFGVDIMPMAVEIARLRAWLSLVMEAEYRPSDRKNNFGIAALPNLAFKFVCANSLIDSGYDEFLKNVKYNLTLQRLDGEIQKLERLRDNYFDPKGDKARKEELQKAFFKTKTYIKTEFASLKKSWNLGDFLGKVDDWNPFDDSKPSSFFSPAWMFGIREGFDIVIGNPPYVNISNLKPANYRIYLKSVFYSAKNKTDLYAFFIEAFANRLKEKGSLIFIIPHTWKATDSFSKFRELVFKHNKVRSIVNLEMGVFEAIVKPLIIHLERSIEKDFRITIFNDRFKKVSSIDINEILKNKNLSIDTTSTDSQKRLFQKIEKNTFPLKDAIQFSRGIKTSNDRRFIGFEKLNEEYKPVFRGKNIKSYKLNWNKEYIWYRPDLMKEKIGAVPYSKKNFEVIEKIVTQRVNSTSQLLVAYDNNQNYFLDTVNVSQYDSWDKKTSLKYLCCLLNSKLINFWYCNKYRMPTIGIYELHTIPIKSLFVSLQQPFITRVNKILQLKQQAKDTTAIEKEIDVMVYKLYGLIYEEVKIIDADFWLSEEEYKQFKAG